MKKSRKGYIAVIILAIILSFIVINSKDFESILYRFFSAKSTEGSRTPLVVYFKEHIWMVLVSSAIAVTLGVLLGTFVTTSYGKEFKELLLKTVN